MKKLFIIIFLLSIQALAVDSDIEKDSYVMCRRDKIVRTIRISRGPSSCKVKYTKDGVDTQVGESKGMLSCHAVLNKVQGNLTQAGWSCKDVSDSRISSNEP